MRVGTVEGMTKLVADSRVDGRRQTAVALALVAAMLFMAILTVVVTVPRPASAQGTTFRSVRIGVGDDALQIATQNPLRITLLYEFVLVYNVYSTLLTYDRSYNLVGGLAYDWFVEPDQENWTFKLVDNAYFTDPGNPSDRSHPVTADDVVFTFNLVQNNPGNIFETYTERIVRVEKVDAHTIRIGFNEPYAAMTSVASAIPILPQYIWSGIGNVLSYRNSVPVGSGALYLDTANSTIPTVMVLRRTPDHYGDSVYCNVVRPTEVRYVSYASSGPMVLDFQNGQLDIIDHIAPADYLRALASWSPKWAVDTGFVGEISVNVMTPEIRNAYQQFKPGSNNPILLNHTVRTAIAMSIDKQALVDQALLGLGISADTLVPSSNPWHYNYPDSQEFVFDTAAARRLLNDAGWTYNVNGNLDPNAVPLAKQGGADVLQFRFYTLNTAEQWEIAARNIVGWLRAAGIETVDRLGNTNPGFGLYSVNQMGGYWYQGDYDIWLWDWIFTPVSDPSVDVLSVETTGEIGSFSDNYYSDSTFDATWNTSVVTIDPAARRALTDQMQAMIYDYASYILPYYRLDLYAANPNGPGRWSNFGNWSRDAALVDDSDLPPLFYQLQPADNPAPVISSMAPVQEAAGTPATISVAVTNQPSAESLTFEWDFGDNSPIGTTTTNTVTHTYAAAGNYTVRVRIEDSEWPACTATQARIFPAGTANRPPQPTSLLASATTGEPGTTIWFNFSASDPDGDDLTVTWDFGDNSAVVTDTVTGTLTPKALSRSHVYSAPGTFVANVTVTDNQVGVGQHSVSQEVTIDIAAVSEPPPAVSGNPFVEIGVPVAIAVVVVAAAVVYLVRRSRARKEEQQREETGPPSPPPPP